MRSAFGSILHFSAVVAELVTVEDSDMLSVELTLDVAENDALVEPDRLTDVVAVLVCDDVTVDEGDVISHP
jgi:hypothetical protein